MGRLGGYDKVKYVEELNSGDCFIHNNVHYLLTSDFKKNNQRSAVSLDNGFSNWFNPDTIVQKVNLYTLDESNNILPIKEHKKDELTK